MQILHIGGKNLLIAGCSDEEAFEIACAIGKSLEKEVETHPVTTRDIFDERFLKESELPKLIEIGECEVEKPNYRNEVRDFLKRKMKNR